MKGKSPIRFQGGRPVPDRFERPQNSGKIVSGVPLARIIKRRLVERPEIVMLGRSSIHAERFRRLKTSLATLPEGAPQVIVVTSGAPSEGKSTIAINLALAFAGEPDQKTLLIDADMRRPTLGRFLEPAPVIGLSHLLSGQATEEHAILSLEQARLDLLPAGEPTEKPIELLASPAAKELMSRLRGAYARIVIDTPPVVPFSDANAIGALADGAILVVRSRITPASLVRHAIESVSTAPLLGVVFNDVSRSALADWSRYQSGHYDRYYYAYYEGNDGRNAR